MNDPSVTVKRDVSAALGPGWRLGFLGMLHMEVFSQRLEQEHDVQTILTSPSVSFRATLRNNTVINMESPSSFPEAHEIKKLEEPMVLGTLVFPAEFVGELMSLCEERRGQQLVCWQSGGQVWRSRRKRTRHVESQAGERYKRGENQKRNTPPAPTSPLPTSRTSQDMRYLDDSRVTLKYKLPLSEVVEDFYDRVKSLSSGYATFDYEEADYEEAKLVRLQILLNGEPVDALSSIVHSSRAFVRGKAVCTRLKENIPRCVAAPLGI
jgi:GTP-binding protein LepA